jgi:hypothetical protein
MSSYRGFARLHLLEHPDDEDAEEAEKGEPSEDIDEGPVRSLTQKLTIQGCVRWV